jgi:hypothetical protein
MTGELTDQDDEAEGDDLTDDGDASCPYCGADPRFGECGHLVAAWNDDDGYWKLPFDAAAVPQSPENFEEWSEPQRRAAFGNELFEAAQTFDETSWERGSAVGAFEALYERLTAPVDRVGWEVDGLMTSSVGANFYSPEPQRVRDEFAELLARLADGFRRLEAMPPAPPGPPGGPG